MYLFMDMYYFASGGLLWCLLRRLEEILSEPRRASELPWSTSLSGKVIVGSTGNAGLISSRKGGMGSTARGLCGNVSIKRVESPLPQAKHIHQSLRVQCLYPNKVFPLTSIVTYRISCFSNQWVHFKCLHLSANSENAFVPLHLKICYKYNLSILLIPRYPFPLRMICIIW